MDFDAARRTMIECQIRTWEVLDPQVLTLLEQVKREDFVPEGYRKLAFADFHIPLGFGESMWAPKQEARMLQALDLQASDRVLEIGTGSGYLTALLAAASAHVLSVEIIDAFYNHAQQKLKAHGVNNVTLELADAAQGWPKGAPYDAIVVTGSLPVLPDSFKSALAVGGRLVIILGSSPVMQAKRITRVAEHAFSTEDLFETDIPPLHNAQTPAAFVF